MSTKPPEPSSAATNDRILTSWKEIANLLGVSIRTAQDYERHRRLPIRRDGKRISSTERELRQWQLTPVAPVPWWSDPRILQRWAITATIVAVAELIGMFAYTLSSRGSQPIAVHWDGSTVTATDAKGRTAWQHQFPYPLMQVSPGTADILAPWIGDIDKDGNSETVLAYYHVKREEEGWDLYCFSSKGEVCWRLSPTRIVKNRERSFSPPYVLRTFVVFPSPERDGTRWTAAVFVHHTTYPSVLMVVDSKGKVRGEFWQAGHMNALRALDLDGDGIPELITGGDQRGAEQAVLLVLDPRNVRGVAHTEPADAPLQLLDMPEGTERATLYFPRTEVNRKMEQSNFLAEIQIVRGSIQVDVYEHIPSPEGYLIYTIGRDLSVKDLILSSAYKDAIQQVKDQKELEALTSLEEIERLKKQVRVVRRAPRV